MKYLSWLIVVCLLGGCSMFNRDKQEDTHKDEQTETTKTVDVTNTPTGSHTEEHSVTVKTSDTAAKTHEELSSPALDKAAASLSTIAASLANGVLPGSGGVVASVLHGLGMNEDAAAGLATVGASAAGFLLHRRGKKKGHEEGKKAAKLEQQQAAQPKQ